MLEARVVQGDGQVIHAGAKLPRPLVVEVTDETGTHVGGAYVSFRLPEDGASGIFHNGLRTEILTTDKDGRAALRHMDTGLIAGQFQIRVTVAKGEARAGVVSTQFIAPDSKKHISANHLGVLLPSRRVVEAGTLLVAVLAVGYLRNSSVSAPKVEPIPTIGTPTVSVGKP